MIRTRHVWLSRTQQRSHCGIKATQPKPLAAERRKTTSIEQSDTAPDGGKTPGSSQTVHLEKGQIKGLFGTLR
jgi:hypothetical protein